MVGYSLGDEGKGSGCSGCPKIAAAMIGGLVGVLTGAVVGAIAGAAIGQRTTIEF